MTEVTMTDAGNEKPLDHGFACTWTQSVFHEGLQLIAEGITELVGFEVAAISVLRDGGKYEIVAVAGSDAARDQLLGHFTPADQIQIELDSSEDWGLLRFVPAERMSIEPDELGWVPDLVPLEGPDAWHPLDLLLAPLYDADRVMQGYLSIDVPLDGRRPGLERRKVLEKYAAQASRAVVTAVERERFAEQVRLANTTKAIVRRASARLSLEPVIAECQRALVEGFKARGMWLQIGHGEGDPTGAIYTSGGQDLEVPDELVRIAERVAATCWQEQVSAIVSADRPVPAVISREDRETVLTHLGDTGVETVLFAPLGAGPECLGSIVLTRGPGDAAWTEIESGSALDIGHDLGRAILNARTFEREHQLVEELQELDAYKSQLIATVSHELKNPLTAILGHLEMLESVPDLDDRTRRSLTSMERGARRLSGVVEGLLLLSKVGDPNNEIIAAPVDLRRVVEEVVDLVDISAAAKSLQVTIDAPPQPVLALGDADELDRVATNLVSNAVKYTPEGGSVTVSLRHDGDSVALVVTDEGIGISQADQGRLFDEFFRSANPVAVAQPGTGLGLAIVKRILERHGGRIEVESELGAGSTFRVHLPAATR